MQAGAMVTIDESNGVSTSGSIPGWVMSRWLMLIMMVAGILSGSGAVAPTAADDPIPDDGIELSNTTLPILRKEEVAAFLAVPDVMLGRSTMRNGRRDAETLATFTRAAATGNPVAEAYLGYLNYMGHGTPQNERVAAGWYRKAALQGLAEAQYRLGLLYAAAPDPMIKTQLPYDSGKAIYWLSAAAAQGLREAKERIGSLYMSAAIDSNDFKQAWHYLRPYAEHGELWAQREMCLPMMLRPVGAPPPPPDDAAMAMVGCHLMDANPERKSLGGPPRPRLSSDAIPDDVGPPPPEPR